MVKVDSHKVNTMCLNCDKYGKTCEGTDNSVWTGCVSRVRKEETTEEREARMFEWYRRDLAELGDMHGRIRFNVIEYKCSFPEIDPVVMAATLIMDGHHVVFDDSSISKKQNMAKEKSVGKKLIQLEHLADTKTANQER